MFNASFALIVVLLALFALPWLLKWMQRKVGLSATTSASGAKVVGVAALGPHQRLVSVEVGPPGARVRLELGVTAQSVNCLHSTPVNVDDEYAAVAKAVDATKTIANFVAPTGAVDHISHDR